MENASKALIIVGGVLITVLIISLAMYVLTSARGVASASEERLSASQKMAFNRFFEYYPDQIKGIDVYNIIGKIEDIQYDSSSIGKVDYIGPTKDMVDDTDEFLVMYNYSYSDTNNDGLIDEVRITSGS